MLICFVVMMIGIFLGPSTDKDDTDTKEKEPTQQADDSKEDDDDPTPEQDPELEPESVDERTELQEALKESLGGGSTLFYNTVRNDTTGNWRMLVYSSAENIVDHAVEYYNAYFESDDETHIAVNLGLGTTSIMNVYSGSMYIDVHEYIDKEEHDAKILGGGALLNSYTVDLSSGNIDDLSMVTGASGVTVDLRSIEESVIAAIPAEYNDGKWFDVSCDAYTDGEVSVTMQLDQKSSDEDAALSLAAQCFQIAKTSVESTGAEFGSCNIIVVNNGAPVGMFFTQDGKNFTSINEGKRTEIYLE